ncbi:FHA domain-containing protein/MCRS_N domain-containing protein, partial [Cephalotus follicularis]
ETIPVIVVKIFQHSQTVLARLFKCSCRFKFVFRHMAALASSSWIPEDDLLLKNAVERGASLEALAKGAVRFSRKFSIGELRDRWHSLLYDPVTSAEASARMVEFELSIPNLLSKFSKSGNFKESVEVPAKRKVESIRKLYYALRKRTCCRPCTCTNQSFLGSPNVNECIGYASNCQEVRHCDKPAVEICLIGDCVENHFVIQEMRVDSLPHGAGDSKPEDIVRHNCFNTVSEKVPSWSVNGSVGNDSYNLNDARKDVPHVLGDSANDCGNFSGVEDVVQSHALPHNSSSFHSNGYSAPQPGVPLWKTIEDISALSMPVDASHGDKNPNADGIPAVPDILGCENIASSGLDSVHSRPVLKDRRDNEKINNATAISESDFVDISDSLLNFANEDEPFFMDADEKITRDKSSYDRSNSLLLNIPNVVHENDAHIIKEPEALVSDKSFANPDDICPTEIETTDLCQSDHGNQHMIGCPDVNMLSSKSVANPELEDEMMECTLNSEDPEIPCNDDVLPGKAFSFSTIQAGHTVAGDLASSSANKRHSEHGQKLRNKEDNPTHPFTDSRIVVSQMLPKTSSNLPCVRHGVKPESLDDNFYLEVSTLANISHAASHPCKSTLAAPNIAADGALKKESPYACKLTDVPLHANANYTIATIPKPETNPSTLDHEESESDDDLPSFADVEAMILEMDLCPDDPDLSISREVMAKYQNEDTKRTIIRLEQSARSSMQRAIASQGALAILFGRRLKYYMKETEVVLGRATDEVDVDIDLGREGPAHQISRRQALIKIERDGSFILKNLGKSSIYLNGKEVATGRHMNITSSSLIEIRDMSFVFEINHRTVKRYLTNRNEGKSTKFEWAEEGAP